MHTAATIAREHLHDPKQAVDYYEQVLSLDPTASAALAEAVTLHRDAKDYVAIARLLEAQLAQAKKDGDKDRIVSLLDDLGDLHRTSLDDPEVAAEAYEAAEAFATSDARLEKLAAIYADHPEQLDRAVAAHSTLLRRDPYRIESYKALRHLYTAARRADSAWCLCQALSVLDLAEEEEREFYEAHHSPSVARAEAAADDAAWERLVHWDLDPLLTRIFALIQPTIVRVRTESLESRGYDAGQAIDCARHPDPAPQTLHYASGVLGVPTPVVFAERPATPPASQPASDDPYAILHTRPPAILLRGEGPEQVSQGLAFRAGRLLASFRPGFYVRHLVPTGTGLRAWLFAAIRLSVPQFPIVAELRGPVAEATQALLTDFRGVEKEHLASAVAKLLVTAQADKAGAGAIDLKKWVAAIDLSGDRAGLLLADDLQATTEGIRSTEADSSVLVKERMKDIVLFSVSEDYFTIRARLGINIEAPRSRR
jgi:hypothetical protein